MAGICGELDQGDAHAGSFGGGRCEGYEEQQI
jgi:hypothetical protein